MTDKCCIYDGYTFVQKATKITDLNDMRILCRVGYPYFEILYCDGFDQRMAGRRRDKHLLA
jgi:hypothetical protein